MSFTRQQFAKVAPTAPTGDTIANYPTYAEAQQAIAYLSDQRFAVESLTIVGTNLTSVERVTGRLSYGRVAIAGAMSGAWFGLFVGLLMSTFGGAGVATGVGFISVLIGAGFGLLFSVLSYALTRGRRDFTSSSQIVANSYAVLCIPGVAGEARRLLSGSPVGLGRSASTVSVVPTMPQPPVSVDTASNGPRSAPQVPTAPSGGLTTYHGPSVTAPEPGVTVIPTAVRGSAAVPGALGVSLAEPPKVDTRWVTADGKPKFGALAADHPGVEIPAGSGNPVANQVEAVVSAPVVPPVVSSDSDKPGQANTGSNTGKTDPYGNDPFAPPRK
jgi:hypothetical protein